jgi:CRP-like cAMP-binding protein
MALESRVAPHQQSAIAQIYNNSIDIRASRACSEALQQEKGRTAMFGRGNKLLAAMGEDLTLLQPYLRRAPLAAGEILYDVGDEVSHVYFPCSGLVSKLSVFEDGSEIECALVGRNGALGALSALGLSYALTRDVCHLPCEALVLSTERLGEAARLSPHIHECLDRYCAWVMISAVRSGACNACHSVDNRLCRWLLTCRDILERDEIPLSQDIFAKMLGVQRSSVSPILQKLRNEGLVALERGRLRILDPPALLARSCECYASMTATGREWLSFEHTAPRFLGRAPRRARS